MTDSTRMTGGVRTSAATYRIRVADGLGEEWSERAHGMKVTACSSATEGDYSELYGELPDGAALMGVLDALYSHGAHLLSVEWVERDDLSIEERMP